MNRTRIVPMFLAALAVAAGLTVAGCGSDDSGGGAYGGGGSNTTGGEEKSASTGSEGGSALIKVSTASGVGAVVVDADGFVVYDFRKDRGTTSSCYGACEKIWPPVTTSGAPKAGDGAMSSQLGTTRRKDGTIQVTYAGHPLYTYTADKNPGEANGQDIDLFGGEWYALQGSGEEAED